MAGAFSLSLSMTLFVITDIEYPRAGFLRIDDAEALLTLVLEKPN